ncbi:ChrR family anti-sigma-E factor [Rhodobacteraceae bacterium]|nr:ChrR family anti-sigma-E factor [Paracoccaceae bacterium]
MSDVKHHLTEALLMSYAAGTLDEGYALVAASHISLCDACRAELQSYEAVGGSLMDDADAVHMSEDALEATMALIDAAPAVRPRVLKSDRVLPGPVQDYVGGDLSDVRWRAVGGGVRQAVLKTGDKSMARLLSIPAGAAMPDHSHGGLELTLVLKGAFRDEDGRFGPGDVEVATEHVHHTPIAEEGEDCICLAVTDAPLRFKGLIPRIAQPFIGI